MKKNKISIISIVVVLLAVAVLGIVSIFSESVPSPSTYATSWSLVPPLVAITLALITKEVYSSLFVGIVDGGVDTSSTFVAIT